MSVEAKCIDDHEIKISLIENSGIQFLDYEVTVDWDNKDGDSTIEGFKSGYFKTRSSNDSCTHYIRLVPDPDHGNLFFNPLRIVHVGWLLSSLDSGKLILFVA